MTKKSSFIDTDVILKIGNYSSVKFLRKILLSFDFKLYIHQYIYDNELILGEAIYQLNEMISANELTVLSSTVLSGHEKIEYDSAVTLLAKVLEVDLSKPRCHKAGEVYSMALAFAKNFDYFISDDHDAKIAAKKHLKRLDNTYLETITMKDIIIHIRENESSINISRKTAKKLYLYGTNPNNAVTTNEKMKLQMLNDKLKKEFDEKLWPI